MDRHEVTNAEYLAFCDATKRHLPEFWGMEAFRSGPNYPGHPVVGVSWGDAKAYADWRGVRLPTEAEWEYAARGGLVGKKYSHGDTLKAELYAPTGRTGEASPSPVASFPPNGFGLHDMTGNVGEWVRDWYSDSYYATSPAQDPPGPGHGLQRVVRGGGWHTGPMCSPVHFRIPLRSNLVDFNLGFRCAKTVGESAAKRLEAGVRERGAESVAVECEAMRSAAPGSFYFDEAEINDAGYRLLADSLVEGAIEVFRASAREFPLSFNAFDSLAEAYLVHGDRELAIANYRKSVELNPRSGGGHRKLKELGAE
jgi:hypothetical protein